MDPTFHISDVTYEYGMRIAINQDVNTVKMALIMTNTVNSTRTT